MAKQRAMEVVCRVQWGTRHPVSGSLLVATAAVQRGWLEPSGGVDKGVLVSPRGCARGGATFCLPVLSPEGEGTFPGHSLRVCRGLYPVKGCTGGEAASRKHLELRRIIRDPEPLGW